MIVARAEMFPVECVVRGYISGSAWKEYKATGRVCGIELPKGLQESDRLPEPIFTPSTKATSGHDENISFAEMSKLVGPELSGQLRDLTLAVYVKAADYALQKGIIIADTKFEFGRTARGITLADEVLTRTLPASGRRTSTLPARRRSRSTSSTFGIIWRRFAGTSSRRRRRFPPKWRAGPARSMSRHTTSSQDSSWMFNRTVDRRKAA